MGHPLARRLDRDRGQSRKCLIDAVLPLQDRRFLQRLRESNQQLGQNPGHEIEHTGGRFDYQNVSTGRKHKERD